MDIKAGDLVMVVKPTTCCGKANFIGHVYGVVEVSDEWSRCEYCGFVSGEPIAYGIENSGCETRCLIRIDPLSEPETVIEEAVA